MSLVDKWIYTKNVYSLGQGQFGFFKGLLHLETLALVTIWIATYYPELKEFALFVAPFVIVGYVTSIFVLGLFLERKAHFIHSERKFSNERDDAIQQILTRLRRIEAKMK